MKVKTGDDEWSAGGMMEEEVGVSAETAGGSGSGGTSAGSSQI